MALSRGVARSITIIGIIELVLGVVAIICGAVTLSKMTKPAGVTVGIWAIYFAIPGLACIAVGLKKSFNMMGVALGTNILGCILAIVGFIYGAVFWAIFSSTCVSIFLGPGCSCKLNSNIYYYAASCSDIATVKSAMVAVTIVYVMLTIVSFVGSIFGCMGICCSPRQPDVVIATQAPVQPGMVMTTQTTSYAPPPYSAQQGYPAAMPQQQVQYPGGVPQQTYPGASNVAYSGEEVTIKSPIS